MQRRRLFTKHETTKESAGRAEQSKTHRRTVLRGGNLSGLCGGVVGYPCGQSTLRGLRRFPATLTHRLPRALPYPCQSCRRVPSNRCILVIHQSPKHRGYWLIRVAPESPHQYEPILAMALVLDQFQYIIQDRSV